MTETILEWLELGALFVEMLAVAVIAVGFIWALTNNFINWKAVSREDGFKLLRVQLGNALLLGLELLVVSDVIDSITTEATWHSLSFLAFLVVVRTILSWSLALQVEGKWPWQPEREGTADA